MKEMLICLNEITGWAPAKMQGYLAKKNLAHCKVTSSGNIRKLIYASATPGRAVCNVNSTVNFEIIRRQRIEL